MGGPSRFHSLCWFFWFELTTGLFLYFFQMRPANKACLLSLIRHQDMPLFHTWSYKNFKVIFLKVVIISGLGDNHFYDVKQKPLFPFYWQQVPRRYEEFLEEYQTNTKKCNLAILERLPRRLPAKLMVALYKSSTVMEDLRGALVFLFVILLIFFGPSNFFPCRYRSSCWHGCSWFCELVSWSWGHCC